MRTSWMRAGMVGQRPAGVYSMVELSLLSTKRPRSARFAIFHFPDLHCPSPPVSSRDPLRDPVVVHMGNPLGCHPGDSHVDSPALGRILDVTFLGSPRGCFGPGPGDFPGGSPGGPPGRLPGDSPRGFQEGSPMRLPGNRYEGILQETLGRLIGEST